MLATFLLRVPTTYAARYLRIGYTGRTMENEHNPYQSPVTEKPARRRRNGKQAGRGTRLLAAICDGLLLAAIAVPIQWKAGVFDGFPEIQPHGPRELLIWGVVGFAIFLLVNGYLLATRAQTVGKAMFGIKIVTLEGENASFGRIVLRRVLPLSVASAIPLIGGFVGLIDVLFIFRKDRRCVHDLIAGTMVETV